MGFYVNTESLKDTLLQSQTGPKAKYADGRPAGSHLHRVPAKNFPILYSPFYKEFCTLLFPLSFLMKWSQKEYIQEIQDVLSEPPVSSIHGGLSPTEVILYICIFPTCILFPVYTSHKTLVCAKKRSLWGLTTATHWCLHWKRKTVSCCSKSASS